MEEIEELSTLPGLSEDPSVVGLLRVEEQQVPIATTTVHRQRYRTNRDSLIPIHMLSRGLESQGVISRTHSPFNRCKGNSCLLLFHILIVFTQCEGKAK